MITTSSNQLHFDERIPLNPKVKIGKLSNGLTYYIQTNKKPLQRAEMRLVVKAGSILEDEDQQGLAHIVEHMAFNGTTNFKSGELVDFFESIGMQFGAHLNASTGFDETIYKMQIPMDKEEIIDQAFAIMRDWTTELLFEGPEIERERKVGLEEYRSGLGVQTRIRKKLLPYIFYKSHYHKRLPIGTEESLLNFNHEALQRFYKTWYRSDLMGVIVVGDVDVRDMEERIQQVFSDIPAPSDIEEFQLPTFDVPVHEESFFKVIEDEEMPYCRINILEKFTEEVTTTVGDMRTNIIRDFAMMVLNERLQLIAQAPNAPFLAASSGIQSLSLATSGYQLSCVVGLDKIQEGLFCIVQNMLQMKKHGVQNGELERAKKRFLSRLDTIYKERNTTDSKRLLRELIAHFTVGEAIPGIEYEHDLCGEIVKTISCQDIFGFLQTWMIGHSQVIYLLSGTENEQNQYSIPSTEELELMYQDALSQDVLELEMEEQVGELLDSKPEKGTIVKEEYLEDLDLYSWTLSNGSVIWLKKTDFQADKIYFAGLGFGGSSLFDLEQLFSVRVSTEVSSLSGLGNLNLPELQRTLAGRVVSASPFISQETQGVFGKSSQEELETLFQMNYLYRTNPRFTQQALDRESEHLIEMVRNQDRSPNFLYSKKYKELLWRDHPRTRSWDLDMIDKIDLDVLRSSFQEVMNIEQQYVLVGNFSLDEVRSLVEQYIAPLPSASQKETRTNGEELFEGIIEESVHLGSEEVARVKMTIIQQLEHRLNLSQLVAGYFFSRIIQVRLRKRLREDLGGVYSVGFSGGDHVYPYNYHSFTLSFGCDPNRLEELYAEALQLLKDSLSEEFTEDEIENTRQQLIRSYEEQLQKNKSWMNHLITAIQRLDTPDRIFKYIDEVKGLQKENIQVFAKQMLNLNHRLSLFWLPSESEKDSYEEQENPEQEIKKQETENADTQAMQ